MFGQMKGYKRKPPDGTFISRQNKSSKTSVILLSLLIFIAIPIWVISFTTRHYNRPQHIEVDGKDCIIKFVGSCNGTGFCNGHNIAVCDK